MANITIDSKDYDTDKMSEELRNQLVSMQFTDAEIARLQLMLAALQTARIGYSNAIKEGIEKEGL